MKQTLINLIASLVMILPLASRTEAIEIIGETMPDIQWQHNSPAPWGDEQATPGGTLTLPLFSRFSSVRRFGPDTPEPLTDILNDLHLPLIAQHPYSHQWIPMLASDWSINDGQKRLFFRINRMARWSDNTPVTTADISFTLEFLTNPDHDTHWQRQQLTELIETLVIYSDTEFALQTRIPASQALPLLAGLSPMARHFYQAGKNRQWPERFNWRPEPVTGPYQITDILPERQLQLGKVDRWWAANLPAFRNRFNVERIIYRLEGSDEQYLNRFRNGELDALPVNDNANWNADISQFLTRRTAINRLEFGIAPAANRMRCGLLINPDNIEDDDNAIEILYSNRAAYRKIHTSLLTSPITGDTSLSLIPRRRLLEQLKSGEFQAIWLDIEAEADDLLPWLQNQYRGTTSESSHWQYREQCGQHQTSRYLAWEWLMLPQDLATAASTNLLDPFNAVSGGLFWIDTRLRSDILIRSSAKRSGITRSNMEFALRDNSKITQPESENGIGQR